MLASSFKTLVSNPALTSTLTQLAKPQVIVPLVQRGFSQSFHKPRPMQQLRHISPSILPHSVQASLYNINQKKQMLKQAIKRRFFVPQLKHAFSTNQKVYNSYSKPITISHEVPPQTIEASSTTIATDYSTVNTMIQKDISLNKFMSKIYNTTGLSIASFLGLGMLASGTAMAAPAAFMWGGFGMALGGIVAFQWIKPIQTIAKDTNGNITQFWENSFGRKVAFSSIIAGSGLAIAPFMAQVMAVSPAVLPAAAGLSLLTMGGASLYSVSRPLGSFSSWRAPLYGSLLALVVMQLTNLGLLMTIGPNAFSAACFKVDLYAGMGLFTAFQVYDTHQAVEAYKNEQYDHLDHVVNYFLNFKNLFVRFARAIIDW